MFEYEHFAYRWRFPLRNGVTRNDVTKSLLYVGCSFIGLIKQVGHNKLVIKNFGVCFERKKGIYSTAKETRKFVTLKLIKNKIS